MADLLYHQLVLIVPIYVVQDEACIIYTAVQAIFLVS